MCGRCHGGLWPVGRAGGVLSRLILSRLNLEIRVIGKMFILVAASQAAPGGPQPLTGTTQVAPGLRLAGIRNAALRMARPHIQRLANDSSAPFWWQHLHTLRAAGLASRAQILCALEHTQSASLEDVRILPLVLLAGRHATPPNTFVELGALDGVHLSNTYMLERCFGWRGVLIEANPNSFQRMQAGARPSLGRSTRVHSAVCEGDFSGASVNFTVSSRDRGGADLPEVTGEVGQISERFQALYYRGGLDRVRTVAVPCRSLASLLGSAGLSQGAAFLSLDVEGAEAKVLATIDPSLFQVVMVELDGHAPRKDLAVDAALLRAGLRQPPVSQQFHVPNSGVYASAAVLTEAAEAQELGHGVVSRH